MFGELIAQYGGPFFGFLGAALAEGRRRSEPGKGPTRQQPPRGPRSPLAPPHRPRHLPSALNPL